MKTTLTLLALLVAAPLLRAQDTSSPAPAPLWLGDPGVDVAHARAAVRERQAARLRWEQVNTVGDYERVGQKNPSWDADVHACLEEYAHALAQEPDALARTAAAKPPCQRAMAAGCKDPLLRYVALRLGLSAAGAAPEELARIYAGLEGEMEKSAYSPLRKFYVSFRAAEFASKAAGPKTAANPSPVPPSGTDVGASLGRAEAHFVEMLRDPASDPISLYVTATDLFDYAQHHATGVAPVLEPMAAVFTSGELKAAGETAKCKLVEGKFWTDYAWQGRTGRWAKDVTDEGWRLFAERLPKAQAALEKAYALDPTNPHVSREMLTVELGQGQGRERMELWFRRALDAYPDYYDACRAKLFYLEPKWYGSAQDMLDFGRQCQASADWPGRLPFILLLAHTRLASYEADPLAYWKRPDVWTDIQGIYKAALAANPASVFDRSGYALYAYRAEQWKLADELFRALGDKPNLEAMQCTKAQYDEMRRITAAKMSAPLTPP